MRKYLTIAVPLVLLLAGVPAQAATIQVASPAGLAASDYYDWGQYTEGAVNGSPLGATSNGGDTATLNDVAGFTRLVEGNTWFGNFTVGDNVLYTGNPTTPFSASNSFSINFAAAVAGLGLQIQSNFLGAYGASLEVFNGGTSLGVFNVAGLNDGNEDGTASFLGARSSAVDITRAVFSLTLNAGAGLGGNRLLVTDTPFSSAAAVPEPGTLTLMGIGAAALIRRRRSAK
jgi:hypothetical protein